MGWDKATGRLYAAKVDSVRLSCRPIRPERRTKGTRNSLIFYIGYNVARKLGWTDGTRIDLYWGDGKDEGWCRMSTAHEGRFAVHTTHRGQTRELCGLFFKTQQHPLNGGGIHPADECQFIITPDQALQVKPPAWFWRDYEKKRPDTNIGRPRGAVSTADRGRANGANGVAVGGAAE